MAQREETQKGRTSEQPAKADKVSHNGAQPPCAHPGCKDILQDIIERLSQGETIDETALAAILRKHNKLYFESAPARKPADEKAANGESCGFEPHFAPQNRRFSKKHLLPAYWSIKQNNPDVWHAWNVSFETERQLLALLQMKPRRTASGVATITVITKPWPCSGACLYCPNDLRMPKSYLSDEPACQRAERNFFDPYLQVCSRLQALMHMGHPTDKVELIVLGGTWSDYPKSYQRWFVHELFRALNEAPFAEDALSPAQSSRAHERRAHYEAFGLSSEAQACKKRVAAQQRAVFEGRLDYNQAVRQLYAASEATSPLFAWQDASLNDLTHQQTINERAEHRVVGLVVETRPDAITCENLELLRRFGCTKLQMGIQSVNPQRLQDNLRNTSVARIRQAFEATRLFGFKTHAHFMVNLLGATPSSDKADYRAFMEDPAFMPDEVKLYPCALVEGTGLVAHFENGTWRPYNEEELVEVLAADVLATPAFARISRMIRDISAKDIMVGNKKTNLRQMVDEELARQAQPVKEIRYREIATQTVEAPALHQEELAYRTTVSTEYFLQWVTDENKIAGFLRLSLPFEEALRRFGDSLPVHAGEAMIREVHVYGQAAKLHRSTTGAQHLGLGRQLIERACTIARENGFSSINVISAVGTREYYRKLGFYDAALYQRKNLD